MSNLTPTNRRVAMIVLAVCIITAWVLEERDLAGPLVGGLLILIQPGDQ